MTEIEKLALARSVYVEHAKADKGEIDSDWERDVIAGNADSCHGVRIALRAITTLTAERDAALERVKRLEEALRSVMHDWHSDTGFVAAVRLATGRPWPWDHGELSLDAARKALESSNGRD